MSVRTDDIILHAINKRKAEEELKEEERQAKRAREEVEEKVAPEDEELDMDAILALVDAAPEVPELDENELKQLVLRFEKCINKNVEMRTKHPNNPDKFMDSEIALNESLDALRVIAASPALYPLVAELKTISSLLSIVPHENTDIGIAVILLLQEMFDAEDEDETDANMLLVMDALIDANGLTVLVNFVHKLDESHYEEEKAVHNVMSILESLVDVKPEAGIAVCKSTKLLDWLLSRVRKEKVDANKAYAGELLAIFLQSGGDQVRRLVGDQDGVKRILKAVARYRKRDPVDDLEKEVVDNLFQCLCLAMNDDPDNQVAFGKADGLDLLISFLRKKVFVSFLALRTLDFALLRCAPNCIRFVDSGGLKILFAVFMGKKKAKAKLPKNTKAKNEEHVVSSLTQLFLNLSDTRYLRLLKKFQENDFQKVDRLVELHEAWYRKYEDAVALHDERLQELGIQEDEEEAFIFKVDSGLFTVQTIAFLLGFVATSGANGIRERIEQILAQQDSSLQLIKNILTDYLEQMGNPKYQRKQRDVLEAVIAML